nr:lytic transglycosylase domain-containing protein [Paraburkholderia sp. CNPSo 3274]
MKRLLLKSGIAWCVALSVATAGDKPPAAQHGAAQIVEHSVAASGRLPDRGAANARIVSGQVEAGEEKNLTFSFATMKHPKMSFLEVASAGQMGFHVYDSSQDWKIRQILGRVEDEPYTLLGGMSGAEASELDGLLVDYASNGSRITPSGIDTLEGLRANNLGLTSKDGTQRDVWVGASSFSEWEFDGAQRRLESVEMFPVSVNVGLIASLAALSIPASAQIFGEGGANGMVILANNPDELNKARMKVNVDESSELATRGAMTTSARARAPRGKDLDTSRFAEVIAEAGRKWHVRTELLRAIIAVESKFNPQAVSRRGALGLMQLMPETAQRFAAGNLFDPKVNVLAGARYLRVLLDLFDDNVELAVAAYNAGEHSVIKAGYRIPAIPETRAYVPAVMARYRRLISG